MTAINRMPTYQESLTEGRNTTRGWYTFWTGLFQGQPTGPLANVQLPAAPATFTYVAPSGGSALINGGMVSAITFSRDAVTFFTTGSTAGLIPMSKGDTIKITYSVLPTMQFVPR